MPQNQAYHNIQNNKYAVLRPQEDWEEDKYLHKSSEFFGKNQDMIGTLSGRKKLKKETKDFSRRIRGTK